MCGIAGLWRFGGADREALAVELRAATDCIAYRGPDGDGHWIDPASGVALGHRRLAIIDLTETGFQPMASGMPDIGFGRVDVGSGRLRRCQPIEGLGDT